MPLVRTLQDSAQGIRYPVGLNYLDLTAHETNRPDSALVRSENLRMDDFTLYRRLGAKKVALFDRVPTNKGAIQFATNDEWFRLPAGSPNQIIPYGGFALRITFTTTFGPVNGAWILTSRIDSDPGSPGIVLVQYDINNTVEFTWESDTFVTYQHRVSWPADEVFHGLLIYDPVASTSTLYESGEIVDQIAVVASNERPRQDVTFWYFGTRSDGAGMPDPNFGFPGGTVDAITLFSLAGTDPSAGGDNSVVNTLRKFSLQEWPNPLSSMVMWSLDCNSVHSNVVHDRSRFQTPAEMSPTPPSNVPSIAYPCSPANLVRTLQRADGKTTNIVAYGGAAFFDTVNIEES